MKGLVRVFVSANAFDERAAVGCRAGDQGVAVAALDGVEAGAYEVLADDLTWQVKGSLSDDVTALYPQLAPWYPAPATPYPPGARLP